MNTLEEAQQLNLLEVLVRCDRSVSPSLALSLSSLLLSLPLSRFRQSDAPQTCYAVRVSRRD